MTSTALLHRLPLKQAFELTQVWFQTTSRRIDNWEVDAAIGQIREHGHLEGDGWDSDSVKDEIRELRAAVTTLHKTF